MLEVSVIAYLFLNYFQKLLDLHVVLNDALEQLKRSTGKISDFRVLRYDLFHRLERALLKTSTPYLPMQ